MLATLGLNAKVPASQAFLSIRSVSWPITSKYGLNFLQTLTKDVSSLGLQTPKIV